MRVQTEEWRRFVPGVRMYKEKKTLFYNGEELWDDENNEILIYDFRERDTWEVVIILPGVEEIPLETFAECEKLETVIMSDSVKRVWNRAFFGCLRLSFVKLSRNVEFIGISTFLHCESLTSIFIPPSCREIGHQAFMECKKLIIFQVPQHAQLGNSVIAGTALFVASSFVTNEYGGYYNREEVNDWIKNVNFSDEFELHQACSSYHTINQESVYEIIKRKGLKAFQKKNAIGITPSQYLELNPFDPFAEIDQHKIMTQYVLEMMGEVV
ncbi:hypothetical protein CTEN210_16015 [Chaetoceros tenuissimus]|uniref:Leucine-rich repeat domain-containing protein n=1 Tax=Chaetoceros tenuissimus TaxID=426638 RepID=A0AAD3HDU9_9STRA|nr:hypothetical protein CTEN210_16015 [Chaetoceros tenuissimus]